MMIVIMACHHLSVQGEASDDEHGPEQDQEGPDEGQPLQHTQWSTGICQGEVNFMF